VKIGLILKLLKTLVGETPALHEKRKLRKITKSFNLYKFIVMPYNENQNES
jgi:hypothetical protein